jgi:hypothetical protein
MEIYLVSYQHLPYARWAEILSDWARGPISVGTLQASSPRTQRARSRGGPSQ